MVCLLGISSCLEQHQSDLITILELDYGLLEKLTSIDPENADVFIRMQKGINKEERIEQLLKYFQKQPSKMCDVFVTALWEADQQHVANFIKYNGCKCVYCQFFCVHIILLIASLSSTVPSCYQVVP